MSAALEYRGVSKSYGSTAALSEVDLTVRVGEVFGFLGPNGAGKTTLIRVALDIVRPDQGEVRLLGGPVGRSTLDRVAYLPEERGLYKRQKIIDILVYLGQLKGLRRRDARQRALHWLERVGLGHVANDRLGKLSKGMSQKVQLAATLLADPELVILDEPFSGLDPKNLHLVQTIIRERNQAGQTTVLSTHQMDQVETLCDRIAFVNQGRIVLEGAVDEVRRRYSSTEALLECSEAPSATGIERVTPEGGNRYRVRLVRGVRPEEVLQGLVANGVEVSRFEPALAPMHQVFIDVVDGRPADVEPSNRSTLSEASPL
ncbi:MAG: ATP-binding cassette domain-containing protein [Myxococcota bacterium]